MLHRLLYANWDDPPPTMTFEVTYREALARVGARLEVVLAGAEAALRDPASAPAAFWEACLDLYLTTPALVNVALNHKVCVEQGLPLHPTYYFELSDKNRAQVHHPQACLVEAQAFFREAIDTSVAVFRLDAEAPARVQALAARMPPALESFLYTSTQDKYTWRASEPAKIRDLASDIQKKLRPVAILGAAHGAIMAGLILATLLDVPLYFIRFSMFKRKDTDPVIAPSDLQVLAQYRQGPVLLFDEDVAKGTTLAKFTDYLKPFFAEAHSAGVLRHGFAGFRPDFVGRVWY